MITLNYSEAPLSDLELLLDNFLKFPVFSQIFDFLTSNTRNLAPTAFLIYKFVWREILIFSSHVDVLEEILDSQNER